ncbi:MAG: hypothetical protein K9H26_02355 [Prolixibacteraceae bacterium]|nr:hypothetical protein [Prolixibacteraceae bacterium]
MKRIKRPIPICLVLMLFFSTAACDKDPEKPGGNEEKLVFELLTTNRDTLLPGQQARLTAIARGTGLVYYWSATAGDILGSGSNVTYATTPCVEGDIELTGWGLSNLNFLLKYNFYSDLVKRVYFSSAAGIKVPASRKYQSVNYVELPYQLQPSQGAFGFILNSSFVKENSGQGIRYFITNRVELNGANQKNYIPGASIFTAFYVSKHLMFPWLKGDWTVILQLRNEIRLKDTDRSELNHSTGSCLFFAVPQINYVLNEKWNISAMVDLPVYQYFNGTQLGSGIGFSAVLSRTFRL